MPVVTKKLLDLFLDRKDILLKFVQQWKLRKLCVYMWFGDLFYFIYFLFIVRRVQFFLNLHQFSISEFEERLTDPSQKHYLTDTPVAQMIAREKAFRLSSCMAQYWVPELSTWTPTFQSQLLHI